MVKRFRNSSQSSSLEDKVASGSGMDYVTQMVGIIL